MAVAVARLARVKFCRFGGCGFRCDCLPLACVGGGCAAVPWAVGAWLRRRPCGWRLFLTPIIHTKRTKTTKPENFFKKLKMIKKRLAVHLLRLGLAVCCFGACRVAALVGFWAAFFGKVFLYVAASVRVMCKRKTALCGRLFWCWLYALARTSNHSM